MVLVLLVVVAVVGLGFRVEDNSPVGYQLGYDHQVLGPVGARSQRERPKQAVNPSLRSMPLSHADA